MTPTITDDDKGTIAATADGKVVRSWQYGLIGRGERTYRMALAREYAEGWHNCAAHLMPAIEAATVALIPPRSHDATIALALIARATGFGMKSKE